MKNMRIALFACALAVAASPGWAWTHKQGSITSIDPKAHRLTLDGTRYAVERRVDLAGLAVGDRVSISAEPRHGKAALIDRVRKIG